MAPATSVPPGMSPLPQHKPPASAAQTYRQHTRSSGRRSSTKRNQGPPARSSAAQTYHPRPAAPHQISANATKHPASAARGRTPPETTPTERTRAQLQPKDIPHPGSAAIATGPARQGTPQAASALPRAPPAQTTRTTRQHPTGGPARPSSPKRPALPPQTPKQPANPRQTPPAKRRTSRRGSSRRGSYQCTPRQHSPEEPAPPAVPKEHQRGAPRDYQGHRGRKTPPPAAAQGHTAPGARTPPQPGPTHQGTPATPPGNPSGKPPPEAPNEPPNEATENSGHPEKTHPKNCPATNQQLPRHCPATVPELPRKHKFRKHH